MTVELSSPVPGVIESILVDRSDAVTRDQVLASLMADVEQEKYNMALAKAQYQGDLKSGKVNLKLSEKESQRATELYKERAIPLNEKEHADAKLELARYELDKAIHESEVFELELKEARANLELRQIRSPIDGVVVDRYMMPGEFVDNKPVLKVAQLNPLRVEVISQVANFGKIKPGMHAYVIPEFGEYDKLVAEVVVVDKVIDAASGTFGVRLMLKNEDNSVPGGLKCRLQFLNEQQEHVYRQSIKAQAVPVTVLDIGNETNDAGVEIDLETEILATVDPVTQCYSLGPLVNEGDFEALRGKLDEALDVSNIREQTQQKTTYVVTTEQQASMQQAQALEEKFKTAGIRDVAIMRKANQLRLSLGLYSSEQRAQRRQAELEKLGFMTEINTSQTQSSHYWYDLALESGRNAQALGSVIVDMAHTQKIAGASGLVFTQCEDTANTGYRSSSYALSR